MAGNALVGDAEKQSPALRTRRSRFVDPNGRPVNYDAPAGAVEKGTGYTPDESVYEIDESNSPIRQFFDLAKEGRAIVEFHPLTTDGVKHPPIAFSESEVEQIVNAGEESVRIGEALSRINEAAFTRFRERAAAARADEPLTEGDEPEPLAEDFADDDDIPNYGNTGTGITPRGADEHLALGNGPFNQQQYLYDFWDGLAKSFWAATHDPVAGASLEIIVDFVLGRGFTVVADEPDVQREWDAFWKLNRGDERIHDWLRDWFRDGENLTRLFPQGTTPPRVAMLEPSTVVEIVTDPENLDDVAFYQQMYATQYQTYATREHPTQKFIIRQVDPRYVIHTKINASAWEKRGRSDLFSVLGWLKRLRDYYNAETLKAIVQAALAWDFTIKGSGVDVNTLNTYADQTPPPDLMQPGQGFYHNDAVEVKALQADKTATATGSIGVGDGLLGIIAIGVHIAKDYLGVTSRGARATAVVAETPAVKHFESRQRVVRHYIERLARLVMTIAIAEGRLPRQVWKPSDKGMIKDAMRAMRRGQIVEALRVLRDVARGGRKVDLNMDVAVTFPDIVKADRSQTIKDAEAAESDNYISKRRAATIVAGAFDISDYDFDEEQDEIASEGRQVIAKTGAQVFKGGPEADEAAWDPGEVPNPAGGGGDDGDDPDDDDQPPKRSRPDHDPAGAGAAVIRKGNRGRAALRASNRKTISFVIDE